MALELTAPFLNGVYQRDNTGRGLVPVAGTTLPGVAHIVATLEPINGGSRTVQTIPVDADGNFAGMIDAPGGWYSLSIVQGNTITSLNRVGVGEVFIIFGHSFMQGGRGDVAATDERAVTLYDKLGRVQNQFGRLINGVGPFHEGNAGWGQLADKLVKRLNVPVLIYGAAYGGSNVLMNYEVVNNLPRTAVPPGYKNETESFRQPFRPLEVVMTDYVPKTGVRAILMEHGYNDRGTNRQTFADRLGNVIAYVRNTFSKPALAVLLVQEELTQAVPIADPETAQGQKLVFQQVPNVWPGPNLNDLVWQNSTLHEGDSHFSALGVNVFATEWDKSITPNFLAQSVPYLSADTMLAELVPLAISSAPATIETIDWVVMALAVLMLAIFYIKKSTRAGYAFFGLIMIALFRLNRTMP